MKVSLYEYQNGRLHLISKDISKEEAVILLLDSKLISSHSDWTGAKK
jgi:hypothetical protein